MGVMKASVDLTLPEDFTSELMGRLNVSMEDASLEIASKIAEDAKASTAFTDYTGTPRESEYHKKRFPNATRLRPNIKAKKSKYKNGGAIVYSRGPHAHLVEYGHVLVIKGKVVRTVPPHQYLRPAAQKHTQEAIDAFASAIREGLGE